jgi:hypothetical protein
MVLLILHFLRILWLPVASFFAGVLNTIAGGGSFLSLARTAGQHHCGGRGGSLSAGHQYRGAVAGQLTSLVAFRRQLGLYGWKLLPLAIAPAWAAGWAAGCYCCTPATSASASCFPGCSCSPRSCSCSAFPWESGWPRSPAAAATTLALIVGMVAVSVYVGYFGAGGGFLAMALFGFCGVHDIHEMNALKVLTAAVSLGIPSISFMLAGRVEWRFCLVMAILAGSEDTWARTTAAR